MSGETTKVGATLLNNPIRAGRKALDIAQLCTLRPLPDPVIAEFDTPLVALLQVAEARVRARVALRLAACSWAPREAVRMLAFEPLEISKPIIARSPVITEDDLLKLACEDEERRLLIARRPRVSETVSAAVAKYRESRCLMALAQNDGAELSEHSAPDFAELAKADEALQQALAGRSDLGSTLANAIFTIAGETVRQHLAERYPDIAAAQIESAIEEALKSHPTLNDSAAEVTRWLADSDQLTKHDVLDSARYGRFEITDVAVATLTGIQVEDWKATISRSPLRVCLLAGRAMAMTAEEASRFYIAMADNGRAHRMTPDALQRACTEIYAEFARDDARRALHRLSSGGSIN